MLSRTADHALRAVLFLAQREGEGPVPAARIAEALGAPANYMSKTLQSLARTGVVEGLRGPTGGFRLSVPAAELTVMRVVEAFDEQERRSRCLLGDRPCDDDAPCAAHVSWTAIVAASRGPLLRTTVADLLRTDRDGITDPSLIPGA